MNWILPVVTKGFKSPLVAEDIPSVVPRLQSKCILELYEEAWNKELNEAKKPSLFRVFMRQIRPQLLLGIVCGVIQGVFATVARPLLLWRVIDAVLNPIGVQEGVMLIVGFTIVVLAEGLAGVVSRHLIADDCFTNFLAAMVMLLQKKTVTLSAGSTKVHPGFNIPLSVLLFCF